VISKRYMGQLTGTYIPLGGGEAIVEYGSLWEYSFISNYVDILETKHWPLQTSRNFILPSCFITSRPDPHSTGRPA
jgi:hypothetical protein